MKPMITQRMRSTDPSPKLAANGQVFRLIIAARFIMVRTNKLIDRFLIIKSIDP
jgi:hypothetical protein